MGRGGWWAQSMESQRVRFKWSHLARAYRLDGKGEKIYIYIYCQLCAKLVLFFLI